MGAPALQSLSERDQAVSELLVFVADYARLTERQIADARSIMLKTVDEMMASVQAINEAADMNLKKADEVLVRGDSSSEFVSKRAKEIDARYSDPAQRVKEINGQISAHMAALSNLDDSVRSVLFSIMGALSMDDVVRQRLEHVTASTHSLEDGIKSVVQRFTKDGLDEVYANEVINKMADVMFRSFTMEEEKSVFKEVLGDIKNYR